MIRIRNYNVLFEEQVVIRDVNVNLGHQMYIFTGQLSKRKSAILEDIAHAFHSYNPHIIYSNETSVIYLPNYKFLLDKLTLEQNICYFTNMYGLDSKIVDEIISTLKLESILNRRIDTISLAQKQMARICCSFLNYRASIIILDQPFTDLQKDDINLVKKYINNNLQNKTIIISKNSLIDLEEYKPRRVIIEDLTLKIEEPNV